MMNSAIIDTIKSDKKVYYINVFLFGLLIVLIYGTKIFSINTVWELGDEAGYLCNAAYFAGRDWTGISTKLPYFGYGYSILLVPLFYLYKTGVNVIHGAIFINTICILLTYFISLFVMGELCDKDNKIYLPLLGFIVSLQPYLMSNALKVWCEVFLNMWVWLIALVIAIAFRVRHIFIFVLLGISISFIPFIHTRAIVVGGVVCIVLGSQFWLKRITFWEFGAFLVSFLVFFVLLYAVKKDIITNSMQMMAGDDRENINMIGINYVLSRIKWLLFDVDTYVIGAAGKILYIITSTGGFVFFALSAGVRFIKNIQKEKLEKEVLGLYIGGIFIGVMFACLFNGVGTQLSSIVYSRYFEFVVSPIFFLGIYEAIQHRYKFKICVVYVIITVLSGVITLVAQKRFLSSEQVYMDTARMPGISYLVLQDNNFHSFILYIILCNTLFITALFMAQRIAVSKILIPLMAFVLIWNNSSKCVSNILAINEAAYADVELAEYIIENEDDIEILFVDSDYKYNGFYDRMQVLLKEKKLNIIPEEQACCIEQERLYVTYLSSSLGQRLEEEGKLLERGAVFGVYAN